jgi:hypothetical protein
MFGLGLILWGLLMLTDQSPFPDANALLPAGGAALIIYSGSNGGTTICKLLSAAPLVFVGLISYSLYLWHWPLLVFAQFTKINALTPWQTIAVIALSFLMAILSWRFVELPFRKRAGVLPQKPLFIATGFAMSCFVAFGLFGHFSRGWPDRLPPNAVQIASFALSTNNTRQKECLGRASKWILPKDACVYGADVNPTYAVWGDSHADALIEMIGQLASRHGQSVKFFANSSCPPVAGVERLGAYKGCFERNERTLGYLLKEQNLHTVILIARWSAYIEGYDRQFGPAEARETRVPLITDDAGLVSDLQARKELSSEQMRLTVKMLTDAGKIIVLVHPIPETGYNIPSTLARMAWAGQSPSGFARPERYYFNRQSFVFSVFDDLSPADKIIRIYPNQRLCDGTRCIVYADGQPLYRDDDHLSPAGANFVSDLFNPLFTPQPPWFAESPSGGRWSVK